MPSRESIFIMKKLLISLVLLWTVGQLLGQTQINGRITDQNEKVLAGASVFLLETKQGTATDHAGNYVIQNVKKGTYTLLATYVGYETNRQQILVTENVQTISIQLKEQAVAFDQITVKATRASEKYPITHTNLNKEIIEKNNLGQDVPYLLRWTPSTVVTSDAGTGIGYTGIRIRGTDPSRINVTINGIPLNDAESQGVFWVDLPDFASSTDNIQIQRGVGTSTNGPAAFGATINLNTSVLHREAYAQMTASVGSFNTKKGNLSFGSGLIDNKFTLDGRISSIDSDGYIDRASVDLSSYYLSAAYIGRTNALRINTFSGKEITYQAWNGVPAQFIDNEELRTYNSAGTEKSGRPHDNEVDDYKQTHYQLLYSHQLNPNWDLSLTGNYTKGKGFFELYKGNADFEKYRLEPLEIGGTTISSSDLIERRWLDNDFYFNSIAANYTSNNQLLNINLGTAFSLYKGDHFGEVIWARFASQSENTHRYYENDATKKDFNLFGKASYQFAANWTSFLDLQYRNINYEFLGFDNNANNVTQTAAFNFINPKVGLTYQMDAKTSLYAYFGVANKEPNRSDFTDTSPNSRPLHETLYDTEVEFKKRWNKAAIEANVYYMNYKNQLVLTGQLNDVGEYTRVNVPNSYRLGLELVGGYQLTQNINLETSLTLSDNRIKSFTEYIDNWDTWQQETILHKNTQIAFSPRTILNANLSYEFFPEKENQKLNLSLLTKYISQQGIDNTSNSNTILPAYNFSDIRIGYTLKTRFVKELGLTLLFRNIFDAKFSTNAWTYRYISAAYDGRPNDPHTRLEEGSTYNLTGFYPQAGRNYLLGVIIKL